VIHGLDLYFSSFSIEGRSTSSFSEAPWFGEGLSGVKKSKIVMTQSIAITLARVRRS
jgi:hypothetical protein